MPRALTRALPIVPLLFAGAAPASASTRTYTLNADFDAGRAFNVDHDIPDQLQVSSPARPHPFIWVACSQRGTVAKIQTQTGQVVAEYLTAPENLPAPVNLCELGERGGGRNPSRTTVTRSGSCWVGNRNSSLMASGLVGEDGRAFTGEDGSVVKYGLLEAGQCVDRNGNGVIDTSTGIADVRRWANPADVDTFGGVSSAEDECILIFKRVDAPWVRQVSVESHENVWVGGNPGVDPPDCLGPNEHKVHLLDGRNGAILRTIDFQDPADTGEPGPIFTGPTGAPYGGFTDCRDVLWCAGYSSNILVRVDTTLPNGDPDLVLPIDNVQWSYGLGLAPDGSVWHSTYSDNTLRKYDGFGNLVGGPHPSTTGNGRGVAVTPADGDVWVADTNNHSVTRHRPDGTIVAIVPVGRAPTGVSVDGAGKVWVTCLLTGGAMRIDPAINAVDLAVNLDFAGHPFGDIAYPYNYSDMTGYQALTVLPYGEWSIVTTGQCARVSWTSIAWTSSEPRGTHLRVEARAAETAAALAGAPWTIVANGAPTGLAGLLLEARVSFLVDAGIACDGPISPILFDLSATNVDVTAPSIECPPDRRIECGESIPEDLPIADDECGVVEIRFADTELASTCPVATRIERTWTVADAAGNESSCAHVIDRLDTTAPALVGVPGDVSVECDAVPPPPRVSATDACDPAPAVTFGEIRTDGACPDSYSLTRTWTARDRCGNAASRSQTIVVTDSIAPALVGVPGDVSVECDAVPPPPRVSATDACDPAPVVTFGEIRTDGACPDSYSLTRTWTARDRCGNAASESQVVTVTDSKAPVLLDVPDDVTVECDVELPPPPAIHAEDACDPAPGVSLTEMRLPGRCPNEYQLAREWTAQDRCGNAAVARQVLSVVDTTPPVLRALPRPGCIWPPNHKYLCFTDLATLVEAADSCPGAVRVRAIGCRSDQPDDQQGPDDRGINGDGNTDDDCVLADDGAGFCVRSERLGQCKAGRTYGVTIQARDACGLTAAIVVSLHVPHDQREHPECLPPRPQDFLAPHESLPFPWTRNPDPDAGLPNPFACGP